MKKIFKKIIFFDNKIFGEKKILIKKDFSIENESIEK